MEVIKCADSRCLPSNKPKYAFLLSLLLSHGSYIAKDIIDLNQRLKILLLMAKSICRSLSSFALAPLPMTHRGTKGLLSMPEHTEFCYRREIMSWRDSPWLQ